MPLPTVTEITDPLNSVGCRRYRICGGDLAPGWSPRGEAWCEVTTWDGETLGSYRGEVWPSAWPALFSVGLRTTHGQVTRLTELGKRLFSAARRNNASNRTI